MRASVLRDGRMVYRDDVPDPVPGPGQVLVAVRSCGICGSDLHFAAHGAEVLSLSGQMSSAAGGGMNVDLGHDVFMGHEFSAEVLEPGPDTETHPAGNPCHVDPGAVVGQAASNRSSTATQRWAATRSGCCFRRHCCCRFPTGSDPQHAALTEPMAVGLHAVNKSADPARRDRAGARLRPDRHRRHRCAAGPRSRVRLRQPTFHRSGANSPPRWVRTRPSIPRRVRRSTAFTRWWSSTPSACPASSTT